MGVVGADEPVVVLLACSLEKVKVSHSLLLPPSLSLLVTPRLLTKPLTLLIFVEIPQQQVNRMLTLLCTASHNTLLIQ